MGNNENGTDDGDLITTYKCSHCGQSATKQPSYTAGCPVDANGNHRWAGGYCCGNQGCGLSFYTNTPTSGCQASGSNGVHVWNTVS